MSSDMGNLVSEVGALATGQPPGTNPMSYSFILFFSSVEYLYGNYSSGKAQEQDSRLAVVFFLFVLSDDFVFPKDE